MTYSNLVTRTVRTANQSSRQGARVSTIVLHHMASTNFAQVLAMWTNATRVGSANYGVSNEGEVVGVVDEDLRAWSLGAAGDGGRGAAFDRHSITFEIENEALGGSWPVSQAAQEATAQVVADICRRYGIACNRTQILGHREVYSRYGAGYATACPGGLDMDWIVNRAAQLLAGPTKTAKPAAQATPAMQGRKKMFGFMRKTSDGSIVIIDAEKGTYRGLTLGEWSAYAANGAKFADVDDKEFTATLAKLTPAS